MMKRILALLLCLMLALPIAALAESADSTDSEFDLSADQEKIAELGVPTVSAVAELKSNADTLWKNGDYEAAARAYAEYAKQANWLANIISGGLEPFYSASYDDRKDWYPDQLSFSDLSSAESKANSYKAERNRAMLYEGLCYYNLGDYESALPLLLKALDLIELDDETNWSLAMNAVYSIVGYK